MRFLGGPSGCELTSQLRRFGIGAPWREPRRSKKRGCAACRKGHAARRFWLASLRVVHAHELIRAFLCAPDLRALRIKSSIPCAKQFWRQPDLAGRVGRAAQRAEAQITFGGAAPHLTAISTGLISRRSSCRHQRNRAAFTLHERERRVVCESRWIAPCAHAIGCIWQLKHLASHACRSDRGIPTRTRGQAVDSLPIGLVECGRHRLLDIEPRAVRPFGPDPCHVEVHFEVLRVFLRLCRTCEVTAQQGSHAVGRRRRSIWRALLADAGGNCREKRKRENAMDEAPKRAEVAEYVHGWTVTGGKIRSPAHRAKTHEQHRTL
jgi:hypothetical protein